MTRSFCVRIWKTLIRQEKAIERRLIKHCAHGTQHIVFESNTWQQNFYIIALYLVLK